MADIIFPNVISLISVTIIKLVNKDKNDQCKYYFVSLRSFLKEICREIWIRLKAGPFH